jgi:hypothetical protein
MRLLGLLALDRFLRRWRVGQRLTRRLAGHAPVEVCVATTAIDAGRHGIALSKTGGRIVIAFDHRRIQRDDWLFQVFSSRPAAVILMFAATRPDIQSCRAEISDGEESGAGIVSFSATDRQAILIPDCEFFASLGYARMRSLAGSLQAPWRSRDDTVLWRGTTTGHGRISAPDMSAANSVLIQRSRLCLAVRGLAGVDAKFSKIAQSDDPARDRARLEGAGIFGPHLEPATWAKHKYALDIDGNSNAWANLFQRLLLGCCVIKVASQRGYRQWYYDALEPWRHFVPVKADLSDLIEKIAWCKANTAQSAEIAATGQAFAAARTFESEMALGTATLNQALARR